MRILINGKLAALNEGTSFEYVSENRLFSGSDAYTLSISFPLRGCPQNLDIFGNINRADVSAQKVVFDCELHDRNFWKVGSIVITEINEVEVKTQFLEGRSEQNFDKTFDKVYINELDLGRPTILDPSLISPADAWNPEHNNFEAVALPWFNNCSEGLPHNFTSYENGTYAWDKDMYGLTWMPYLSFITRKICEAVDYEADFAAWENSERYKYLLICNVLPDAWDVPDYARALPHWTVDEYFEKLELFLGGEFNIDHRHRRISFEFSQDVLRSLPTIEIKDVVDEYSTEVHVEDGKCEYLEAKNMVYKAPENDVWKLWSCNWFIKLYGKSAVRYDTLDELLAENRWLASTELRGRDSNLNKLLYAADVDTYFIIRAVDRTELGESISGHMRYLYRCVCQPVNFLGGRILDDSEDAQEVELEFVPVRIDDTEEAYGHCAFLEMSGYSESSSSANGGDYRSERDYDAFRNTGAYAAIMAGEHDQDAEYYDRIYVGYWDGSVQNPGKLPYPYVEDIAVADDWRSYRVLDFSFRIQNSPGNPHCVVHSIDPQKKTTFKFIADAIPDVRSLFLIRNKRYVCEKITATFSEDGMSRLLKAVMYPVVD